jgi:ABC-type nitrate/sulfonate/bicarbonate transport system permease component
MAHFPKRRSLSSPAGSANVFATAKLFVPIIVIALIGVVLTEFGMWLEPRMSRWRQLERERF